MKKIVLSFKYCAVFKHLFQKINILFLSGEIKLFYLCFTFGARQLDSAELWGGGGAIRFRLVSSYSSDFYKGFMSFQVCVKRVHNSMSRYLEIRSFIQRTSSLIYVPTLFLFTCANYLIILKIDRLIKSISFFKMLYFFVLSWAVVALLSLQYVSV
jgi:hypothetical protein